MGGCTGSIGTYEPHTGGGLVPIIRSRTRVQGSRKRLLDCSDIGISPWHWFTSTYGHSKYRKSCLSGQGSRFRLLRRCSQLQIQLRSCLDSNGGMQLRGYQRRIVQQAETGNTIVLLPTGSGKTLVAAEVIVRLSKRRSLFLVPTCLLVEQQARAVRLWSGLKVGEFKGGSTLPSEFDVLVSTPTAFEMAQQRLAPQLNWSTFDVVVFDEVHHILKDHPYRKIALQLQCLAVQDQESQDQESQDQQGQRPTSPRIVGLTASLTYAVNAKRVQLSMERICAELAIRNIATATEEELQASGYHARSARAEVAEPLQIPQVPGPTGILPLSERSSDNMIRGFFHRVRRGTATPFGMRLVASIRTMEAALALEISCPSFGLRPAAFLSPLERLSAKEWGVYAKRQAEAAAAAENETLSSQLSQLQHWYEALRLLLVSWEQAEDAAVTFLRMNGLEAGAHIWDQATAVHLRTSFWSETPESYPRFDRLREVLLDKAGSSSFRGVLFVEQRVMTHILEYIIQGDRDLQQLLRPACLYASGSPATAALSLTRRQVADRLAAFGKGDVNLLITTVVAEEGMDVPAANCIIRFDPMLNSVSFVQGRGRARQANSSFVVLSEREDRPAYLLEQVEKQQKEIAQAFKPTDQDEALEMQRAARRKKEVAALPLLRSGRRVDDATACLNEYAVKTQANITETWTSEGLASSIDEIWVCHLTYISLLRSAKATSRASIKKLAKAEAASQILGQLLQQCG